MADIIITTPFEHVIIRTYYNIFFIVATSFKNCRLEKSRIRQKLLLCKINPKKSNSLLSRRFMLTMIFSFRFFFFPDREITRLLIASLKSRKRILHFSNHLRTFDSVCINQRNLLSFVVINDIKLMHDESNAIKYFFLRESKMDLDR